MATVEETRSKIESDPDYVALKRFDYSIKKVLEKYPDGAPVKVIAQGLLMTEEEVEELLGTVILKLRDRLNVTI
jgi:glycerol-3-phosphate responsive antiterminator